MPPAADIVCAGLLAAAEFREAWLPLWALELIGQVLLLAWLFAVGASVGSFLNVVVYRLPAGINLVHPSSRCPRCLSPVRLWHNIPIFGWFLLRGRCRDCRLPISPRYPLVEFLVALSFVVIASVELYAARVSELPSAILLHREILHAGDGLTFWLGYAIHVILVTTLIGAALLEFDRQRIPTRLFIPVLLLGLVLPLFWPELRRVPFSPVMSLTPWQAGLADGAVGLAVGALLGSVIILAWACGTQFRGWPRFAPEALLASVGVVLGWQRLLQTVPPALLIYVGLIALQRTARSSLVVPLAGLLIFSIAPAFTEIDSSLDFLLARTAHVPISYGLSIALAVGLLAAIGGALAPPQYFRPHFVDQPTEVVAPEESLPSAEFTPPEDLPPPEDSLSENTSPATPEKTPDL